MKDLNIQHLKYSIRDDGLFLTDILEQIRTDMSVAQIDLIQSFPQPPKHWQKYAKQSHSLLCFAGSLKLVLFDERRDSPDFGSIREIHCGEHDLQLIEIPAGIYSAYLALGGKRASLLHCGAESLPEPERLMIDTHLIPYQWDNNL